MATLSNIMIFAREIEQTSVLYSVCLGLKIKFMSDIYLELADSRNQQISFYKVDNFAQQTKGYSPILVFRVNQVEEMLNKMCHYGATREGDIRQDNTSRVAFLQGINGEMISIQESCKDESESEEEQGPKSELDVEIQQLLKKIKI